MSFIEKIAPYRKAIVALLIGLLQLAALYFTLTDDGALSPDDRTILLTALIGAITSGGVVYQVPNKLRR